MCLFNINLERNVIMAKRFANPIRGSTEFIIKIRGKKASSHPRFLKKAWGEGDKNRGRGGVDVLIIYSSCRDFQIRPRADANGKGLS